MAKVMNTSIELSGRHGDLVYVKRGDCYFVRTYVPHLRTKSTEDQKKGQGQFTMSGMVYDFLEDEMKRILKTCMTGHSRSGRNLFISLNYHAMVPGREEPDYQRLRFSRGRLQLPDNVKLHRRSDGRWELTWVNPDWETGTNGNDRLYVVELHPEWPQSPRLVQELKAVRRDGRAVFDDLKELGTGEVHFYCFFGSPEGAAFSDTIYLGGGHMVTTLTPQHLSADPVQVFPIPAQGTGGTGFIPAMVQALPHPCLSSSTKRPRGEIPRDGYSGRGDDSRGGHTPTLDCNHPFVLGDCPSGMPHRASP